MRPHARAPYDCESALPPAHLCGGGQHHTHGLRMCDTCGHERVATDRCSHERVATDRCESALPPAHLCGGEQHHTHGLRMCDTCGHERVVTDRCRERATRAQAPQGQQCAYCDYVREGELYV